MPPPPGYLPSFQYIAGTPPPPICVRHKSVVMPVFQGNWEHNHQRRSQQPCTTQRGNVSVLGVFRASCSAQMPVATTIPSAIQHVMYHVYTTSSRPQTGQRLPTWYYKGMKSGFPGEWGGSNVRVKL